MTLSTDIYVTGTGASQREVYDKVNDLLGIPAERKVIDGPNGWSWQPGSYRLGNEIGQGFPAIVDTYANADGSLVTARHDDDCEPGCDSSQCTETFHVHVDLDTAYGYRDGRGWGCSHLHAFVILELAAWLAPKGCAVRWTNEYAGSIHDASDQAAFERFLGDGSDAAAWFSGTALPAILAHAAAAVLPVVDAGTSSEEER